MEVDTGEHPRADRYRVTIAESAYAECLASKQTLNDYPGYEDRVLQLLKAGAATLVHAAPPTMVSACVAVISRSNRTLLLRRSLSVTTYPGQWTVGINESMKYSDEPGAEEDFFGLVRRGLLEEVGLEPADYGDIVISWFGWSQDAACYALVALVRVKLTEREVEHKRQQCHSIYEHDLARWTPLRKGVISNIITGASSPKNDDAWNYLSPLVAAEIWRCQRYT